MYCKWILKEFEIEAVVVLIFRIDIKAVDIDGTGEVMVHDFAVSDSISEIFDFHFGAGFRDDLFDPAEDGGFAGHGAGSAGLLHHGFDKNEELG